MRVLNLEPGFCCFRSVQTFTSVRSRTNPTNRRKRKTNVERVYRRRIGLGPEGLYKGSKLNAACTKTNRAKTSRNSPAAKSLVVLGGTFMSDAPILPRQARGTEHKSFRGDNSP